jgi:hypothetical protein
MKRRALSLWSFLAAFLCLLAVQPASAAPIEVSFLASDGSAYGQFAFERRDPRDNPGELSGGFIEIRGQVIDSSRLFYEYYGISDSLNIRIAGNEGSGLDAGDFLNLRFGNPDGSTLELPTWGNLSYSLGGVSGSTIGRVSAVPEPVSAGLFAGAVGALAWRRRRRSPSAA